MENYASANGDRAKQDELIRQQMRSEKGDYASILNVLGALRQEDPELYEMCLNYSDNREDESEANSDEEESVSEADSDSASESDTDSISEAEADTEDRRQPKRIRMSIHQNDAIQMLWGVKGELDFSQKFCSVVIECEVSYGVEFWRLKHTELIAYMEEHKQSPNQRDKVQIFKKLGIWVCRQKTNYAKTIGIMARPDIRSEWENTLQTYGDYLCVDFDKKWRLTHAQLIAYMEEHKQRPSDHNKNPVIKKLGIWCGVQKKNYIQRAYIMSNPDIRIEWESTLQKYGDYLCDLEGKWRLNHAQVIAYIEEHNKAPNPHDINPEIKKLGMWCGTQKKTYSQKINIMSQPEIRIEWESTLQKYGDYLCDLDEKWHLKHAQVIAYMEEYKKRPSDQDTNPVIKKLGCWVCTQKNCYIKNESIMTRPKIRTVWETTLQNYEAYLCDRDNDGIWRLTHAQVIAYMEQHKKRPTNQDTNPIIKKLGRWVGTQKNNYKNKTNIMEKPDFRSEWENTLQKYGDYLCDLDEKWRLNHKKLITYMEQHKHTPSSSDKNPEIKKIGKWLTHQKENYTKNIQIMSKPDIRTEWEATLQKYREYLHLLTFKTPIF